MNVTAAHILAISPACKPARAAALAEGFTAAIPLAGITNLGQLAALLAQCAHESMGFRFLTELWGPTRAQVGYEGRLDLGNTQPGDGSRYRGRSPIQLTGRGNYRRVGRELGLDLEGRPELAADPEIGPKIAAVYWRDHRGRSGDSCNAAATRGDFEAVTRLINGGVNGLSARYEYLDRALKALANQEPAPAAPAKRRPVLLSTGEDFADVSGKRTETAVLIVNDTDPDAVRIRVK